MVPRPAHPFPLVEGPAVPRCQPARAGGEPLHGFLARISHERSCCEIGHLSSEIRALAQPCVFPAAAAAVQGAPCIRRGRVAATLPDGFAPRAAAIRVGRVARGR